MHLPGEYVDFILDSFSPFWYSFRFTLSFIFRTELDSKVHHVLKNPRTFFPQVFRNAFGTASPCATRRRCTGTRPRTICTTQNRGRIVSKNPLSHIAARLEDPCASARQFPRGG